MMRPLLNALLLPAALYLAWLYGPIIGEFYLAPWLESIGLRYRFMHAAAGGFVVLLVTARAGQYALNYSSTDSSANMTSFRRYLVGWLWIAIAFVLWAALFVGVFVVSLLPAMVVLPVEGSWSMMISVAMVLFVFFLFLALASLVTIGNVKEAIGILTRPFRRAFRGAMGVGGSAAFGGLLEEWSCRYKANGILLGASLIDPSWKVGLTDPRMVLTVAGAGGGKGRCAIIPALLNWPGSVLVVDPKGTNAAVTAATRGHGGGRVTGKCHGQNVYCLNPFGINKDLPGMPPSVRFNPLSTLGDEPSYEDVEAIADALVAPGKGDPHWKDSAKAVIRGLIYYAVKTIPKTENRPANLGDVRDLLTSPDGLPVTEMGVMGGLARETAGQLISASDKELGSIMSTTIQQTEWIYGVMRDVLSESDFNFMELKVKPTTIYLILPLEHLQTHSRFLRLYVNLAVKAATIGGKSRTPVLFLLDEFYSLGRLESLAAAMSNVRSYGIKIWPILQNLGQIRQHYPENWETFIANAGFVQFFSINDMQTLSYVQMKMGRYVMRGRDEQGNKITQGVADLRTAEEVGRTVGRDSGRMLVLREGEDPLLLRRINYDMAWHPLDYNQDPDVPLPQGWDKVKANLRHQLYLPSPYPPGSKWIGGDLLRWWQQRREKPSITPAD